LLLTVVIGTGRCGSTMLSQMLQLHPDVLSLSEFWNVFRGTDGHIPTEDMNGAEFWRRITRPDTFTDGFEVAGIPHDEFLYPADRGRFDPATGVPAISRVLAQVADDPDGLYDRLAGTVPRWPPCPVAEHCRALFTELATIFERIVIVERTGTSVTLMPVLRRQFPEANFLFLHRDGADSALSMSRHAGFRLVALRIVAEAVRNPSPSVPPEYLPDEIRMARPEDFDGLIAPPFDKERFMTYPLPLTFFGWVWSMATRTGTSEIREVAPSKWTTMRYEQLIADTSAQLIRLAGFIGAEPEPRWLDEAARFVDPRRPGRASTRLHPGDVVALRAACAAGKKAFDLLEAEHEELGLSARRSAP
jgi:hypothetical protein